MTLHNEEPRRKNIRLQGYDYARAGLYFLTVVVQNRLHLFAQVVNGEMILNDAGRMIEKWYCEIENKFPDKRCREMVVMPNHMHCIIEILEMDNVPATDTHITGMDMDMDTNTDTHVTDTNAHVAFRDAHVGAPLRGRPEIIPHPEIIPNSETTVRPQTIPHFQTTTHSEIDAQYGIHNKKYGATIGDVMDWFKTMTTNEYIRGVKINTWPRYDGKLWQRNYYDHIIRDWQDEVRISDYILDNPAKWEHDKFNDKQQ